MERAKERILLKILKELDTTEEYWLKNCIKKILSNYDIYTIKDLFPILTEKSYFDTIAHTLLSYFLGNQDFFNNEIIYLLNIRKPKLSDLKASDIHIIISLKNGLEYLLDNIYELNCNDQDIIKELTMAIIDSTNSCKFAQETIFVYGLTEKIKKYFSKDSESLNLSDYITHLIVPQNYFNILLDYIIHIPNGASKTTFFELLIKYNYPFDLKSLLVAYYKNPDEYLKSLEDDKDYEGEVIPSEMPKMLSLYLYQNNKIKKFLLDNFDELLRIEENHKFTFIYNFRYFRQTKKYRCLLDLFNEAIHLSEDQLNLILKRHEENFIINFIDGKSVKYETVGTCAEVFRVGEDKILKISEKKYEPNSITKHFLICPTEQRIIYDDDGNPELYIEIQPYLSKEHNGKPICEEDIINFLNELKKYNIDLTDRTCLALDPRNFGFLRDYHDATLVGLDNIEDAPKWWKDRPIVIYDIDLMLELTNEIKKSLKQ